MFPLVILGTYFGVSWEEFFFPDDDERYVFEFIRIAGGRHDGTLMILRQHEQNGRITAGVVTEAFSLVPVWGRGVCKPERIFVVPPTTRRESGHECVCVLPGAGF